MTFAKDYTCSVSQYVLSIKYISFLESSLDIMKIATPFLGVGEQFPVHKQKLFGFVGWARPELYKKGISMRMRNPRMS